MIYDPFEHWEWDAAFRRTHDLSLRGRLAPESAVRVEVGGTEVYVEPGKCVAWLCEEPADELACEAHRADFAPDETRRTRLSDDDIASLASLPEAERRRAQRRLSMQRARQDPEYRNRQNARRRAVRAAS